MNLQNLNQLGMVRHAWDPSLQEAEAGGWQFQAHETGDVAQLVECVSCVPKALGAISGTA